MLVAESWLKGDGKAALELQERTAHLADLRAEIKERENQEIEGRKLFQVRQNITETCRLLEAEVERATHEKEFYAAALRASQTRVDTLQGELLKMEVKQEEAEARYSIAQQNQCRLEALIGTRNSLVYALEQLLFNLSCRTDPYLPIFDKKIVSLRFGKLLFEKMKNCIE